MNERMKILIGYDGSECADAALDDLKRAGLPQSAEAHILSVAEVCELPKAAEEWGADCNGVITVIFEPPGASQFVQR